MFKHVLTLLEVSFVDAALDFNGTVMELLVMVNITGNIHMFIQRNIIMYVQNYTYISNHVDIDECSDGTHNCPQTCMNTEGSFTCGCNSGYILDTDGTTCNGMYKLVVLFW